MATLKILLHSKKSNDGNKKIHHLALRVTVNRKRSYYYFGHALNLEDWNAQTEKVKKTHPKCAQINRLIRKKYDQVDDIIFESQSSNTKLSAKEIVDSIRCNPKGRSFFELADEHVLDDERSKKFNRAISDRSKIKRIREFVNFKDLPFKEIDTAFLKKLKINLLSNRGLSERSVMNIFVLIRLLYNQAIQQGIVVQSLYPFGKGKVKIKFPQTLKIGLTEDEIHRIESLPLYKNTLIYHTRNVFLFSFYLAGIRISDVLRMRWSDIVDDRIYYKMSKNNKVDSLKIPSKIFDILKDYKPNKRSNSDYIFPELKKLRHDDGLAIYTSTKSAIKRFNRNLGKIAEMTTIEKKITNHIARHSFGNIAGDKVSPQMLQKLYRHTNLSTTVGYQGNCIHKNADEALDAIINF